VRCIVIQTAFLGDALLTLPLLDLLRRSPAIEWVGVLAAPAGAEVVRLAAAADRVIEWDKRAGRGPAGTARVVRALRECRADAALVPHRSFRSALLPLLAGVRTRVGFDESGGRLLLTETVRYRERAHEVERIAILAARVGVEVPGGRVPYALRARSEDRDAVERFLGGADVGPSTPLLLVAPGSRWATKRWLPERFAAAARALARDLGAAIAIAGGPGDAAPGRAVAAALPEPPVDAVGRLSVGEWTALTERAAIVLSNDSAAAHAAAGLGTPVVAVFGPTVPAMGFSPYSDRAAVLGAGVDCRPCGRHGHAVCPLGHHACMTEISADAVLAAARGLLAGSRPS